MTSQGFVKASSNNLPNVDMFMLTEFIKNDERFNAPEFRGAKAAVATREQYGDSAIGYVELKREGSLCILQCKICPEHKVRTKNYTVVLTINEDDEKVLSVECKDCAASEGGCKHALAFLMWVHRRSEEPSPTDVASYWVRPRLSAVGSSLKYVAASEFGQVNLQDVTSTFKEDLLNIAKITNLDGQIMKYEGETSQQKFDSLSIFKLLCKFSTGSCSTCDDFLNYLGQHMTSSLCLEGENLTRKQSTSPLWHELRFGRVTASKLHEVAYCRTPAGTLVDTIIGAYKVRDTKLMQRGRILEKKVLECVENKLKVKIGSCGLFLHPNFPVFGASPDGITEDCVFEVKCPSSEKQMKSYIRQREVTPKFKAQVHLQMFCTNKKKRVFCVADPKFEETKHVEIIFLEYEEDYINLLLEKALLFWKQNVFPKLQKSVL